MKKGFVKVNKYRISFEMNYDIEVYAPEGTDYDVVRQHAEEIARDPMRYGWDFPEVAVWCQREEAVLDPSMREDAPPPEFSNEDTYVLSGAQRVAFVLPEEDLWWVEAAAAASLEPAEEDPRQERLPFGQTGEEQ